MTSSTQTPKWWSLKQRWGGFVDENADDTPCEELTLGFFGGTSMHGLPRAFELTQNPIRRLFWISVVAGGLYYAAIFSRGAFEAFISYDTTYSTHTTAGIQIPQFPAISICPSYPVACTCKSWYSDLVLDNLQVTYPMLNYMCPEAISYNPGFIDANMDPVDKWRLQSPIIDFSSATAEELDLVRDSLKAWRQHKLDTAIAAFLSHSAGTDLPFSTLVGLQFSNGTNGNPMLLGGQTLGELTGVSELDNGYDLCLGAGPDAHELVGPWQWAVTDHQAELLQNITSTIEAAIAANTAVRFEKRTLYSYAKTHQTARMGLLQYLRIGPSDWTTVETTNFMHSDLGECVRIEQGVIVQKYPGKGNGVSIFGHSGSLELPLSDTYGEISAGVYIGMHARNDFFDLDDAIFVAAGTISEIRIKRHTFSRLQWPYGSKCIDEEYPEVIPLEMCLRRCQDIALATGLSCPSITDPLSCPHITQEYEWGAGTRMGERSTSDILADIASGALCKRIADYQASNVDEDLELFQMPEWAYCPLPCNETSYEVSRTSDQAWPSTAVPDLNVAVGDSMLIPAAEAGSYWTARIYFPDYNEVDYKESITTPIETLIGNLGGNFGLFLGTSIMTFLEFFEFGLVTLFRCTFCRAKAQNSKELTSV